MKSERSEADKKKKRGDREWMGKVERGGGEKEWKKDGASCSFISLNCAFFYSEVLSKYLLSLPWPNSPFIKISPVKREWRDHERRVGNGRVGNGWLADRWK